MSTYTTIVTKGVKIYLQQTPLSFSDFSSKFLRVDSRIMQWGLWNEKPRNTRPTLFSRHSIKKDFTYQNLFASFGRPLESMTLSLEEAEHICNHHVVPFAPSSTYFLLQQGSNFFVGRFWFRINDEKGDFYVYKIEDEDDWSSGSMPQVIIRDQNN